jgi:hypothetical protein
MDAHADCVRSTSLTVIIWVRARDGGQPNSPQGAKRDWGKRRKTPQTTEWLVHLSDSEDEDEIAEVMEIVREVCK